MENLATIIVGAIVFAVFIAIIVRGVINRKNGKHGCSCGCHSCGMSDVCRSDKEE